MWMKLRLAGVLLFRSGSGVKSKASSKMLTVFNIPVPDSGVVMDPPQVIGAVFTLPNRTSSLLAK